MACTRVGADMTVAITRTEHTAAVLRRHAAGSADASIARRLLALALVLDGYKRADAARAAGMDGQTSCDWVRRCNADGLAGLGDRHGGGAPSRLPPEQEAAVAGWIRTGPGVEEDGVLRWRCVGIQARPDAGRQSGTARERGAALHGRCVGKPGKALALPRLRRLRFARVSTRPRHPKADPAVQACFGPAQIAEAVSPGSQPV